MKLPVGFILFFLASSLWGCVSVKPIPNLIYPRPIYPISRYPMASESAGVKAAIYPFAPGRDVYTDPAKPAERDGGLSLNVLDAGVMPVRLILLNEGEEEILFDPDQIRGMVGEVAFRTYSPQEAVDLVTQSKEFKEAIEGSQVGPVLKSILGGEIFVEAFSGGVSGVASGGITGGASGVAKGAAGVGIGRARQYERGLIQLLTREYTGQQIKRQTLAPGYFADGLIFLPSQVGITEIAIPTYNPSTKKSILLKVGME